MPVHVSGGSQAASPVELRQTCPFACLTVTLKAPLPSHLKFLMQPSSAVGRPGMLQIVVLSAKLDWQTPLALHVSGLLQVVLVESPQALPAA